MSFAGSSAPISVPNGSGPGPFLPVSFSSPSLVQFFSSSPPISSSVPPGSSSARSSRIRAPESVRRANRLQRKAELARISRRKKKNHLIELESRARQLISEIAAIEAQSASDVTLDTPDPASYLSSLLRCALSDSFAEFQCLSDSNPDSDPSTTTFSQLVSSSGVITPAQTESFLTAIRSMESLAPEFNELYNQINDLPNAINALSTIASRLTNVSTQCFTSAQLGLLSQAVDKLDANVSSLSGAAWNREPQETLSRSNSSISLSLSHSHSHSSIYSLDPESQSFPSVSSSSDLRAHEHDDSAEDSMSDSNDSDQSDND